MGRTIATLLLASVLTACAASSSDDPPAGAGVRGVVTIEPACPVELQGSPCPDRPWSGTVRIIALDGTIVAEVDTDRDGRFAATLAPGGYDVVALTQAQRPPTGEAQRVIVEDGAFTRLSLAVDVGIR